MQRLCLPTLIVTLPLALASAAPAADGGGKLSYNRDVRPILSDNCFHCHGNDKNKVKGKLLLNNRDAAIAKRAIVPGKPDESGLVARILSNDPDESMPPPEAHKTLSDAQKAILKRWVAEGAEYQPHWAYITPARQQPPAVKDVKSIRNPIDRFVLAGLEGRGLGFSPGADRRTLVRRLSLDLVGLPPAPDEVEAFVNDPAPDAYEKVVDRLLASPHYGERMAVPWLDAVRFADTVGFHGDQNQNVFPYRDYVIDAFNDNKPFDRFTIEQLAGDLLPKPTTEQLVASGFNRLNMMTREGGAQAKEYFAKYQADRVRTVSMAWLGSTFGCAECHDHKFDPISTKDFYAMSAFFADVRQWGVYTTYAYTPNPDLPGWTNDHPFPPEILVDSPYLAARKARLQEQVEDLVAAAPRRARPGTQPASRLTVGMWAAMAAGFLNQAPDGWQVLPVGSPAAGQAVEPLADGFVKPPPAGGRMGTVDLAAKPVAGWVAAVRLDLDGSLLPKRPGGGGGQPVRLSATLDRPGLPPVKLGTYHADADHKESRYASTEEVLGVQGGWKLSAAHLGGRQSAVWLLDPPVYVRDGDGLTVSIAGGPTGLPARVSTSPFASTNPRTAADDATRAALAAEPTTWTVAQETAVRRAYLVGTGWAGDAKGFAEYKRLHRDILECRDGKAWTQVTVAQQPVVTRVLPRGNWQDESGEVVAPTTPHFLPALPASSDGRRLSRLDLANWLVAADNPLTSRVVVNRFWKQFFGTGLCASVEDLGLQGEWPSHPELLDWLAVEFRQPSVADDAPWDVKRIVRLIVTSSTYRQASNLPAGLRESDPGNRLLAAQSPRRLEAEFVRDNALAAAGLLHLADVGGPSAKPYQPDGYYAAIQFPDRVYRNDADERQYRRGVYTHWQRTFLHPMLANFDAPSREDSICTRVVSNTPQQALTLLNDPSFVEASRVLAAKLVAAGGADEQKLEQAYQRVLARSPKPAERDSLLAFVADQRAAYRASPDEAKKLLAVGNALPSDGDPAEVAAWANACRVVLNLHEAITRY